MTHEGYIIEYCKGRYYPYTIIEYFGSGVIPINRGSYRTLKGAKRVVQKMIAKDNIPKSIEVARYDHNGNEVKE